MTAEERRSWIMLVVTIGAYAAYVSIILRSAGTVPLVEVPYVAPLLWSIGIAIAASIVLNILAGIFSGRSARKVDQRDREINRLGEYVGQSFLVIGGVGALVLAMAELDYFWIANVIYLCFVLSSVLGSVAKFFAYRRGF